MKKLILFCTLSLCTVFAYPQKFKVPSIPEGIEKSEYVNYEQQFLSCFEWLTSHAPTDSHRKAVNGYAIWWMTGTPDVHIALNTDIISISNSELMILFLGGWSKAAIDKDYVLTDEEGTLAGIQTAVEYYLKYKDALGKDKNMDNYAKLYKEGHLKEFVNKAGSLKQ